MRLGRRLSTQNFHPYPKGPRWIVHLGPRAYRQCYDLISLSIVLANFSAATASYTFSKTSSVM